MFNEIRDYFRLIIRDDREKPKKNMLMASIIIILFLLILSRTVLINYVSDDLALRLQQSKILFINNLSPYDDDVKSFLQNKMSESRIDPDEMAYDLEIALPQMVLYLPFTFFSDPIWGISFFLTFSAFFLVIALFLLFQLLNNGFQLLESLGFFLLSLFSMFFLRSYLSGGLQTFNFFFLIGVIFYLEKKKMITSGILLGMLAFDVINIPLIIFILVFGLLKLKNTVPVFWSIITFSLLSLLIMIFDRNWIIGWLKNLFLTPQRMPFLTFPDALSMKYDFPSFQLFTILSLLLIIWYVFEVWRNLFNSPEAWLWVIGLSSIINYFLIIQETDVSALYLLIPQTLIFSIWRKKITGNKALFLLIPLALITIVISVVYFAFPEIQKDQLYIYFMLISSIIFSLNLYWLRRWAVQPYDFDNLMMNG